MADRAAFLQQIREQAAKGQAYRVALNPDATAERSYVGGGSDPVASLLAEWTAVGGRGQRVTGSDAARDFVRQFVLEHRIQRAIRWRHPLLDRLELDSLLTSCQVDLRVWDALKSLDEPARWDVAFSADLGITSVNLAVAETGSLVLCSTPAQGRVVSLLPARFLAIVEFSQIVPDLFDVFKNLEARKHDLPSNIVFVTGPSKTGDIELKLTTGVHGPGDVHLLVVE